LKKAEELHGGLLDRFLHRQSPSPVAETLLGDGLFFFASFDPFVRVSRWIVPVGIEE
jgi:hypothetical protein